MRLHRLRVSNFAGVRDTEIEFGPGLNVLYGPNDLGKSTLVDAIRLALLLPHTSSYCDQFVPWTGAFNPMVELTFQTESQRIWRVKKEFGRGGSSLLQESKDGRDFDDVVRARSVDGRLRQILGWGIAEPGGSGGLKGLPPSFLATALLSTQADVTAMLRDSLQSDSTTSGKERIEAALQAVAQDPMFIALLRYTQERRDAAYTPTGGKKTSRGSVFKAAAERLNLARDDRDRLHQIVVDSQAAEKHLRELTQQRAERQDALDVAKDEAAVVERLAVQLADRTAAVEQVRLAQDEVKRIRKIGTDVDAAEQSLAELARKMADAEQALKTAREDETTANAILASAEDAVRVEDTNPEITDTVARQKIELQKAEADRAATSAQQRFDAATDARRVMNAFVVAEGEYLEQMGAADRARASVVEAGTRQDAATELLGRCELLERALDFQAALKRATEAQVNADKGRTLRERLDLVSSERENLRSQQGQFSVPSHSDLLRIRRMATDLATARGTLNVGIVVTLSPNKELSMEVRKDGSTSESTTTARPVEVEANTEVEIAIRDVATVLVRGGRREAQQNVAVLEERWAREVVPDFDRAGVIDLEGLEARISLAKDLDASIKSKDIEIESLQSQIAAFAESPGALEEATQQIQICKAALGGASLETLTADLNKLGNDPRAGLRKRRQQLSTDLDAARKIANDATNTLTLAEERCRTSKMTMEEAVQKRDDANANFPEGITQALQTAQSALAGIKVEKRRIEDELATLEKAIDTRKKRIDAVLASARKKAEDVRAGVQKADEDLTKARTDYASQLGLIEGLRRMREAEDLQAAEGALKIASERLESLPVPERNVGEQELSVVKRKVHGLASALELIDREIQRAHGALAQVGGAVARERLQDAIEAFELAERQEKEVEEEYEAWKLLLEQMKESEKDQASNLGQALAPAIANHFQALTQRRYENVQLTPQLGTEGVIVSGTVRSAERMSVGTREQLSTLYRLSLAEYLRTVVVLDDQLVQSDETRMDWFRALLKDKSRIFQIIVFTCRPRDYLEKSGLVPKKGLFVDTDEGFTRALDLGRALQQEQVSAKTRP